MHMQPNSPRASTGTNKSALEKSEVVFCQSVDAMATVISFSTSSSTIPPTPKGDECTTCSCFIFNRFMFGRSRSLLVQYMYQVTGVRSDVTGISISTPGTSSWGSWLVAAWRGVSDALPSTQPRDPPSKAISAAPSQSAITPAIPPLNHL